MADNQMRLQFASLSQNEGFARSCAAAFAAQMNPTIEELSDIRTAISEAVTNAIIHGYEDREGMVSLDCTMVANPVSDEGCHMGVDGCVRVLARLTENGNADGDTLCYANHFSHNGAPLQENLERLLSPHGIRVAYDGLGIEL